MSSIINTDNFAVNFLPPKKRLPIYKAWAKTLLNPLQVLYNTMFGTYKDGNSATNWFLLTSYNVGDQVKFVDKSIYQCWVASGAGIEPTNTDYWFKIQDKFVGIEPRIKYNAQHLLFEWALNEWFGTTFVNTPGSSDIYILNIQSANNVFYVGFTSANSSLVVYENGEAYDFIQNLNITNTGAEFAIYVPVAVWTALASTNTDRDNTIRQIADNYVYAGINYDIITY